MPSNKNAVHFLVAIVLAYWESVCYDRNSASLRLWVPYFCEPRPQALHRSQVAPPPPFLFSGSGLSPTHKKEKERAVPLPPGFSLFLRRGRAKRGLGATLRSLRRKGEGGNQRARGVNIAGRRETSLLRPNTKKQIPLLPRMDQGGLAFLISRVQEWTYGGRSCFVTSLAGRRAPAFNWCFVETTSDWLNNFFPTLKAHSWKLKVMPPTPFCTYTMQGMPLRTWNNGGWKGHKKYWPFPGFCSPPRPIYSERYFVLARTNKLQKGIFFIRMLCPGRRRDRPDQTLAHLFPNSIRIPSEFASER